MPPPWPPLSPTPIRRLLLHRRRRIFPAGRAGPIVLFSLRRRRTSSLTRRAIVVILIVIINVFSSFNDADPSHVMVVDCCMLYCPYDDAGRHGQFVGSRFTPFLLAIISRHTHHKSAKPKSDHMPTTDSTEYLRQYSADEDI